MEGVGFYGDDVVAGEFFCAEGEHLVGEVYGQDGGWLVVGCPGSLGAGGRSL